MAVRLGKFFVQRVRAHANMPLPSAADLSSSSERFRGLVTFVPESHGGLKFCRWAVKAGIDASERGLSASMYRLAVCSLCCTSISDESKHALGLSV